MELEGLKIAFLGDSITEGVGASTYDKVYHQVLKNNVGLEEVYNYGISGTRIARQSTPSEIESYDKHFATRLDEMEPNCDIVVIFGGTNDHGHGDASFGEFNDRSDGTFYGALHNLLQRIVEKYPEKQIVCVTPLHRIGDSKLSSKPDGEYILRDYVNAICEVAEHYSIPVLNLYAVSGMNPNVEVQRHIYFPDGIHPSDKGHERIAQKLENFLRTL